MKRHISIIIVLTVLLVSSSAAMSPFGQSKKLTDKQMKAFETNLLEGLKSDNNGLKVSSAFYLGEIRSQKAIAPLMKMLEKGATRDQRLMAALSLIKIGSEGNIDVVLHDASVKALTRSLEDINEFSGIRKFETGGPDSLNNFYLYVLEKHLP